MTETAAADQFMKKILQQMDTLLALQRAHLIKPDNIFTFLHDDQEISMHLPHAIFESMQQKILLYADFYEFAYLKKVKSMVEGGRVLDVGANIGNHSIYFAKVAKAESVMSFEPQRQVFKLLERNIELNQLTNVVIKNTAVGAQSGTAGLIAAPRFKNLGATSFQEGGDYEMCSIDSLETNVDFLKIDVEGFHMNVLRGAADTIATYRPVIWIELRSKHNEYAQANELMTRMGYEPQALSPDNFIYRSRR